MQHRSRTLRRVLFAAATLALAGAARANLYTDTVGDKWSSASYIDIASVDVTNDATNLYVTVNVAPGSNLTDSSQQFGIYELGLHTGAGGQTLINRDFSGSTTSGNPYGTPVGASTGINTFVGLYSSGGGGGDAYTFNSSTGWTHTFAAFADPTKVSLAPTALTAVLPLSSLGLNVGDTFNFDVWSTFSGNNSAYDALDNAAQTFSGSARVSFASGGNDAAPYDSATESGSTFASTTYTVVAPEPVAGSLLALSLGVILPRRR